MSDAMTPELTKSGWLKAGACVKLSSRKPLLVFLLLLLGAGSASPLSQAAQTAPPGAAFVQAVPFAARLYYEEARARLKAGKSAEAIAKLREALAVFPEYFAAQFELASELTKQGQRQAALEALEQARRINDRDPRVYRLFGLLMLEQQKFKLAEFAFREAIQRDPTFAQTYYSHAVALIELALNENEQAQRKTYLNEAEQQLNKTLGLTGGKHAQAYLQRARIHEQRGAKQLAVRDLETFLKLHPQASNAAAVREAIATLRQ